MLHKLQGSLTTLKHSKVMEDQKQQIVSSYVRYKKEKPETKDDLLIPAVLLGSITIALAIMLWQVTLSLGVAGALTYKLHKVYEHRAYMRANGLPVNYWDGKRTWV